MIVAEISDDQGRDSFGFSYVLGGSGDAAVRAAQSVLDNHVIGTRTMHPESLHRQVRNTFNRSGRGPLYLGLAAVDVAQWDLYAKHLDVPLGVAMGRQLPTTKKTWECSVKHPGKARLQGIRLVHRAHSGRL